MLVRRAPERLCCGMPCTGRQHGLAARVLAARVCGDKAKHTCPGIGRGAGKLCRPPVKEAVRSAGIRDNLVWHTGGVQLVLESRHLLRWNPLLRPAEEREERVPDLPGALQDGAAAPEVAGEARVEADDAGQADI